MSGRFVRASKYRHVFGDPAKPEKQFTGVSTSSAGEGNLIAAGNTYIAFPSTGGGGPVVVLRRDTPGRQGAKPPILNVHKGPVLDLQFSPFLDTMIGTCGEDCVAKISVLPGADQKWQNVDEAAASLEGHSKKVHLLRFHPVANNVVATAAYDNTLKVWDMEAQTAAVTIDDFKEYPLWFDWNTNGSLIASTAKDKLIRIFDPRNSGAVITAQGFPGVKSQRCLFMDNHRTLIVLGFNNTGARQYAIWDPKKMDKPLTVADLDQGSSVMAPFYDPDNSILYIAGKGDGNIKYYEAVDDAPYLHFLSDYRDTESQKGVTFLPKRCVDVGLCEIALCMRLLKDKIVPISFQVPRKSDMFAEDLFPDTYAGVPALTSQQYFAGENAEPPTVSMKPGSTPSAPTGVAIQFKAQKSPAELQKELSEAEARIAELMAENEKLKKKVVDLGGSV